ncbi:indolethylamine N-methyltransferase-like [Ixodes scapularis]
MVQNHHGVRYKQNSILLYRSQGTKRKLARFKDTNFVDSAERFVASVAGNRNRRFSGRKFGFSPWGLVSAKFKVTSKIKKRVSTVHSVESMASEALRDAYKEKFLPRQYLDEHVFGKYSVSQIEQVHSFFQSDLIHGETLLDVGSGPVVFTSLIASSKFKHIVLSDLVEGNRLELNKWINNEEDAIDWSHAAEQIAAVEGNSDIKKGALQIIERTRSAIRKVVPCDVLEPGVLPMEHRETFDVVISNGCLDAAAADHESFRRVICNVAPLVKPGGLLVIVGAAGIKSYPVGTANFPHANLTENVLKEAVTDAGFQIKRYRSKELPSSGENSEVFMFNLVARKT